MSCVYTYHPCFAWWPTRVDSGRLVWLSTYYIHPTHNGVGRLLSKLEYQLETHRA